jgi:hypothetical protein
MRPAGEEVRDRARVTAVVWPPDKAGDLVQAKVGDLHPEADILLIRIKMGSAISTKKL